jgi:uncharacterized protein YndB with AHSA1/START domain
VSPEDVFEVLATPETYVDWEVGSSAIHRSDDAFPDPGTIFEHSHGIAFLQVHDTTQAIEVDPPRRLVLEVRLRPFFIGLVEFRLRPERGGTRVIVEEKPIGGLTKFVYNPLLDLVMRARNAEMLRRLRNVVQRRARRGA